MIIMAGPMIITRREMVIILRILGSPRSRML